MPPAVSNIQGEKRYCNGLAPSGCFNILLGLAVSLTLSLLVHRTHSVTARELVLESAACGFAFRRQPGGKKQLVPHETLAAVQSVHE